MLLSVYEHLGLNVQKASWLPSEDMEFISAYSLIPRNMYESMPWNSGSSSHWTPPKSGGNLCLFSEQHMQKEWFRWVLHAQSFTSIVEVVFSVVLSHVINEKCLHLTAENQFALFFCSKHLEIKHRVFLLSIQRSTIMKHKTMVTNYALW